MFTSEILLDTYERSLLGNQRLLQLCAELTPEEFVRKLEGFGFQSIQLQLFHLLASEEFWVSVLRGRQKQDGEWNFEDYRTLEALVAYQDDVAAQMRAYLAGMSPAALAAPVELPFDDTRAVLVPEHVIMRNITHCFHHRGQIAAMLRLLGHPVPQDLLDYPLEETLPAL